MDPAAGAGLEGGTTAASAVAWMTPTTDVRTVPADGGDVLRPYQRECGNLTGRKSVERVVS